MADLLDAQVTVTPLSEDAGLYRVVLAANSEVAADEFELDIAGLDLTSYMRNPVVMYEHGIQHTLPIGRTERMELRDGQLEAAFRFANDPFAARVQSLWEQGILNGASVRWTGDDDNSLIEWSVVPIPADPDALRFSHQNAVRSMLATPAEGDEEMPDEQPAAVLTAAEVADAVAQGIAAGLRAGMTAQPAPQQAPVPQRSPAPPAEPPAAPPPTAPAPEPGLSEEEMREVVAARSRLIEQARPFLPADFDPHTHGDGDILRSALGDLAQENADENYLRGQLQMLTSSRERATSQSSQFRQIQKGGQPRRRRMTPEEEREQIYHEWVNDPTYGYGERQPEEEER